MQNSNQGFWGWLLNIDWSTIPEESKVEFALSAVPTGIGATMLLLLGVFLLGLFVVLYRREETDISGLRRIVMTACRIGVLAAAVLILLRPTLTASTTEVRYGTFILLVDSSASMSKIDRNLQEGDAQLMAKALDISIADVRKMRRYELAEALIDLDQGQLITALHEKSSVEVYRFDSALTEISKLVKSEDSTGEVPEAYDYPALEKVEMYGRATHIGDMIKEVLSRHEGEPIAGILVISDGKVTGGADVSDAREFARVRQVPIWAVPIGDAHKPKNLELRTITAPPAVFQGKDPYTLSAEIYHQGLEGEAAAVVLELLEGEQVTEIERRNIDLGAETAPSVVMFKRTPGKLGMFKYRVRVEPLPKEENKQDNSKIATVEVKDSWAKVLLVSGGPTFEYRVLRNYLARETNLELGQWLQSAAESWNISQNKWNWGAARVRKAKQLHAAGEDVKAAELLSRVIRAKTPSWYGTASALLKRWGLDEAEVEDSEDHWLTQLDLSKELGKRWDVIILLDIDSRELEREHVEELRKFVEEKGGGLLFGAGEKHAYPFLSNSALSSMLDMLPVIPDLEQAGDRFEVGRLYPSEYRPEITAEGLTHALTSFVKGDNEANRDAWNQLPPMYWGFPVKRHKPHARVLLRHSNPDETGTDGKPMAVAAIHNFGPGKVLWLGFDETYRWRGNAEEVFQLFWTQAVRYLTTGKLLGGRRRARFILTRSEFDVGEPIRIQVTAMEPDFQSPLGDAEVLAEVSGPDVERTLPMQPIQGRPGWYEATFHAPRPGQYRFHLAGFKNREYQPLQINVIPARREFRDARLDEPSLRRLTAGEGAADPTNGPGAISEEGGIIYAPELKNLPDAVPDAELKLINPQPPNELWASPLAILLIMLLLTTEWVLRKVSNLL